VDQETNRSAVQHIDAAVLTFITGLGNKETKLSVSDVMRLIDLRKEVAHDELREVRVTWVESNPGPFAINM